MLKSTAFALSFIRIPICVLIAHYSSQSKWKIPKRNNSYHHQQKIFFCFQALVFLLSSIRLAISVRVAYFDTFIYFAANEHELLNYQDN